MYNYEVIETIKAPGNEPVSRTWCRTNDLAKAIAAMANSAAGANASDPYYRVESVELRVNYEG